MYKRETLELVCGINLSFRTYHVFILNRYLQIYLETYQIFMSP